MTLLITGGAGYIGSHAVLAAKAAGYDILVADNFSTGRRSFKPDGVTFHEGNIGDPTFLKRLFSSADITDIIHFAGSIIVPESVENPLLYYHNNTAASRTLIEAAVEHDVRRFLFSSTAAVYGDPETIPVSEDTPIQPLSPYGTSKWMTEMMLRDTAAAHPLYFGALRYFNVSGADPAGRAGQATPRATHLIKVACEAALGKRAYIQVFGDDYDTPDGTGIRDYIHVSDLADVHIETLNYLSENSTSLVMNCGYGRGYSVLEVIDAVKRVSGVDFRVDMAPRRAGDSPKVVAGIDRLQATLGWTPKHNNLDHIVQTALAFERSLEA